MLKADGQQATYLTAGLIELRHKISLSDGEARNT